MATGISTPLLPVIASTTFKATRTGRLAFGGGVSPDSLAFNLATGLDEPAANGTAGKDLQVSGLASTGTLTLGAGNTTRYYATIQLTAA